MQARVDGGQLADVFLRLHAPAGLHLLAAGQVHEAEFGAADDGLARVGLTLDLERQLRRGEVVEGR